MIMTNNTIPTHTALYDEINIFIFPFDSQEEDTVEQCFVCKKYLFLAELSCHVDKCRYVQCSYLFRTVLSTNSFQSQ